MLQDISSKLDTAMKEYDQAIVYIIQNLEANQEGDTHFERVKNVNKIQTLCKVYSNNIILQNSLLYIKQDPLFLFLLVTKAKSCFFGLLIIIKSL